MSKNHLNPLVLYSPFREGEARPQLCWHLRDGGSGGQGPLRFLVEYVEGAALRTTKFLLESCPLRFLETN